MDKRHRLGIIGYGYIGRSLHHALHGTGVTVERIYNRSAAALTDLSESLATTEVERFLDGVPELDLVVELAHPDITRNMGEHILRHTSYMACSVTAFADDELTDRLLGVAAEAGTDLFIPHGAVVGVDNLIETRRNWKEVTITFRKPPASIGDGDAPDADETVLFEGSVREIAGKYPRNVNAMVACALATVGLDSARARIIADRRQGDVLRGEFEFTGEDGSTLTIVKQEPAVGVSSPGMVSSIKGSVLRAFKQTPAGLQFV